MAANAQQTDFKRISNAFHTDEIAEIRLANASNGYSDFHFSIFRPGGGAFAGANREEISCGERFVFPRLVCAISFVAPVGCHTCRRLRQERARTPAVPGWSDDGLLG
jgi:hypothetical protein